MVCPHRTTRTSLALALAFAAVAAATAAVDESAWRHRQPVVIASPGLVRLDLPDATLDAARPDLRDLRLLDPAGNEVAFAVVGSRPRPPVRLTPTRFDVALDGPVTRIIVATGTSAPLASVGLETPAAGFLKPATIEYSDDGHQWETLATGRPVLRQSGAENLDLLLTGLSAEFLRITLDDSRSRPVPITGVHLVAAPPPEPAPRETAVAFRREEFAGETVLTLDLGARHLPLAGLEFETAEPVFTRNVTLTVREFRDDEAVERPLTTGSLYRLPGEAGASIERRSVALEVVAPARELLVHVANGDSPPLPITAVRLHRRPVFLIASATTAGSFRLLAGNAQVAAPRYDLSRLANQLREAAAPTVNPGPLAANPDYRAPAVLADVPLAGAPLDPSPWRYRKPVALAGGEFHELELDVDVLSHARADLGDLRLVSGENQVPYLVERTGLIRTVALAPVAADDPKRPAVSRWEIVLPRARLPLRRLVLTTTTPLFQRSFRIYERITDNRGNAYEQTLASTAWNRRPGDPDTLTVPLTTAASTDRLIIETENGDNPPIALGAVQVGLPVTRLLFRADGAAPVSLHYGRADAFTPRYDLALVADRLVAAERHAATLGTEEGAAGGWAAGALAGLRGGPVFWGALVLVVGVLLFAVARLLPKPPAAGPD